MPPQAALNQSKGRELFEARWSPNEFSGLRKPARTGQMVGQQNRPYDEKVVIGLVNNMPDAALRTTERQFRELLSAASQTHEVRIRHFTLPELVRAPAAQSHINQHYEDLSELWASQIDGLIVTGTEPRASALTEEPYWDSLTRLVDWAQDHTFATIWSCLAAHAATLHIDGITRRRLPKKLSGVFGCVKAKHPVSNRRGHSCPMERTAFPAQ